ncbi:hypothetical protein GCM10027037_00520 [Mucilaginibacter koreensis]
MRATLTREELLLLRTPVGDLPASRKLRRGCAQMGFRTLQEIMELGWGKLIHQQGFTYRWMNELTALLEQYQLLHLLQANPSADYR